MYIWKIFSTVKILHYMVVELIEEFKFSNKISFLCTFSVMVHIWLLCLYVHVHLTDTMGLAIIITL